MTHRFQALRRFQFNLPQRIAAGLLALFLVQGFWLTSRQTLTDLDYQYARCGRETWEKPSPLAGYYTSCGNIHDGILAYRLAGLPLTLNLLLERGLDLVRKPENRVVQDQSGELSTWELRHQMTHVLLLLRLPFLFAGFLLGGCIWWVTRRLYGNLGGYTALALYCFSPAVVRACVTPNPEVLTALGLFGGVYTCIGVAHAMQGSRRKPGPPATGLRRWGGKWRPRLVLLTAIFGVAAAAHIVALPLAVLLGLTAMLWVAEGHRSQTLPVVLVASVGALLLVFACYGFSPDAASYVFRSDAGLVSLLARSGQAILQRARQWRHHSSRVRRGRVVSGRAQIALLRQHNSVVLRFGLYRAGDEGLFRKPMALGAAFPADFCGRRVRRRLRRSARALGDRRGRGDCRVAGSAVRVEFGGADLGNGASEVEWMVSWCRVSK